MPPLLTVNEALTLIEAQSLPLAAREVPLREALGLQLAADVLSDVDSPPHDKALMDGYAVLSGDDSAERRVLEEIAAGATPTQTVTPGTATRIMTGAPLPTGADAVVPIEQTTLTPAGLVRFSTADHQPGQHLMRRGDSFRAGQVVVERGATIRALEIGICAEAGCGRVPVIPLPTVCVLPTGDELVPIDEKPGLGTIRNSNGPMLAAAVREAGYAAREMEVARDERQQLASAIAEAMESDVVLLSGGVSAGTMDLVPAVLTSLGVQQVLHKVSIKPGKPVWFGVKTHDDRRRTLVFGLPGNPLGSFVCFQVFVRPALSAIAGRGFAGLRSIAAKLGREIQHRGDRETFLPVRWVGKLVEPVAWRGSADLAAWSAAEALLRLPAGVTDLPAGQTVEILPLNLEFP
ncbi:MAG: gephyrin-like molybdotransferase Glp [Pirellulales bacterium]